MFCTKCGKELAGTEGGFCSNCGAKITGKQSGGVEKTTVSGEGKRIKIPAKAIVITLAAVLIVGAGVFAFLRFGNAGNGNTNNKGVSVNHGGRTYFVSFRGIYSVKEDGSDMRKLSDDQVEYNINVVGNRIYYINRDDGNKIYTIKTNGSDRKPVD